MFWKTIVRDLKRAGISRKLVLYIVMCSTGIALLATAVQLYFDYTSDMHLLDQRMDQIESSFCESISDALWNLDHDQVSTVTEGILRLPDVVYVEVIPEEEGQAIQRGTHRERYVKTRSFKLSHQNGSEWVTVGYLSVEASLIGIFQRLKQKFLIVLATQGVKTFLVALFMFIIFNTLIIRHLDRIAEFAINNRFTGEKPNVLSLDRQPATQPDEIDDVVIAINQMQTDLYHTYHDLVKSNVALDEKTRELARHKQELEKEVQARTAELKKAQESLLEQAHQAGMAEIATGVLHNVGNALNSVNISGQLILERVSSSSLRKLEKTMKLIEETRSMFEDASNERLAKVPDFLSALCRRLAEERDFIRDEVKRMHDHLTSIRNIVKDQQDYAGFGGFDETVDLCALVKEVVHLESTALEESSTTLGLNMEPIPLLTLPKAKIRYALLHLIKNAREAVLENQPGERHIEVQLLVNHKHVHCRIKDNGSGLAYASQDRVFDFGYSTKGVGRGFGLHTCSLAMKELGGDIWAESDGVGKGSTFTLVFPLTLALSV
ncbi:MAG: ATP-binding protein [Acidobacteria bacterium]|nr:ATP-binding protein [Acidobacteriota bacterium]